MLPSPSPISNRPKSRASGMMTRFSEAPAEPASSALLASPLASPTSCRKVLLCLTITVSPCPRLRSCVASTGASLRSGLHRAFCFRMCFRDLLCVGHGLIARINSEFGVVSHFDLLVRRFVCRLKAGRESRLAVIVCESLGETLACARILDDRGISTAIRPALGGAATIC